MFKEVNKKYKEYSNKLEEFDRIDLDKAEFNKCVEHRLELRKAVSKGDKKKDDTK